MIYGEYDCATWNQFGGVDPSLNYVWFLSLNATASPAVGGMGMSALPAGTFIAGAVNFAHQGIPAIESDMLVALGSAPGSAQQRASWANVNAQFSEAHSLPVDGHPRHRLGCSQERAELGVGHGGRRYNSLPQPRRWFGSLRPNLEVVVRQLLEKKRAARKRRPFCFPSPYAT